MAKKLKVQAGAEHFVNGVRQIRLTPLDQVIPNIPDAAVQLIVMLVMIGDTKDLQPGDGELDFPVDTKGLEKLSVSLPVIAKLFPKDGTNIFLRVSAA